MISRFFRAFFWFILFAAVCTYGYLGFVQASAREAIVVEHYIDGVDPKPIRPGEWRFIPSRATPGQVLLHRVPITDGFNYTYRRGLAQSDALGLKDEYYIKFKLNLTYSLDQKQLLRTFRRLKYDWSKLSGHVRSKVNEVLDEKIAEIYPDDRALSGLDNRLRSYLAGEGERDIRAALDKKGIQLDSISIKDVFIPDPVQYRGVVARSGEFIARELERIKQIDDAKAREHAARILDRAYFARLEGIGRLLRKYPHLREYLAIDRLGKNVEVVVMPYDRFFGSGNKQQRMGPAEPPRRLRGLEKILRKREDRERREFRERKERFQRREIQRPDDNRSRRFSRNRPNGNDFRNGGNGGFVDLTPP